MPEPTVVVSRDGSRAVSLVSHEGRQQLSDQDALGLAFRLQLAPGAAETRVLVLLDTFIEGEVASWGFRPAGSLEAKDAVDQIAIAAIAQHLSDLPPGTETAIRRIDCDSECLRSLARVPRASDESIFQYLKAKIYWGWKYDQSPTAVAWFDAVLLGTAEDVIHRVSQIGEGEYYQRGNYIGAGLRYKPLPRLLREFPLSLGADLSGAPAVPDILQRLGAPRYAGPHAHLEKSIRFLSDDTPDPENAAKESICAVEGLARIIAGDPKATLGELIARFRAEGKLNPALARSLEAVWGFASDAPGVRHGSPSLNTITLVEAHFVHGASRAALGLLLSLDTP